MDMGARWQSSQRPLFVRTVWVNGRRHAILSRDDPLLRFPRPASSTTASDTSSETSTCCQLEDCLIKLRLALQPESYQGTFQESIFPIRHGTVEASHCYDHDDSDSCFEEEVPTRRLPLLGQYPKVYSFEPSENSPFLPDLQLNPLSERVLQWLDLSGKGKRLSTAIVLPRESESSREQRKHSTSDARRPHVSRRRELQARSLSMDVTSNVKLTTRSAAAALETSTLVKRKKPITLVVAAKSSLAEHCHEDHFLRRSPEEPPVIQSFEPPRLLRPNTAWPSTSAPNRPQLHIFMPPLVLEVKTEDISENESNVEEHS